MLKSTIWNTNTGLWNRPKWKSGVLSLFAMCSDSVEHFPQQNLLILQVWVHFPEAKSIWSKAATPFFWFLCFDICCLLEVILDEAHGITHKLSWKLDSGCDRHTDCAAVDEDDASLLHPCLFRQLKLFSQHECCDLYLNPQSWALSHANWVPSFYIAKKPWVLF